VDTTAAPHHCALWLHHKPKPRPKREPEERRRRRRSGRGQQELHEIAVAAFNKK